MPGSDGSVHADNEKIDELAQLALVPAQFDERWVRLASPSGRPFPSFA